MPGLKRVRIPEWTGCLGWEPTPEMFVAHTVAVFREVRRVLRPDGTLWLNFGDTYASGGNGSSTTGPCKQNSNRGYEDLRAKGIKRPTPNLKRNDMVGIPWRVALALQADGWWLRRDNIWFKPNPMPESMNGWRWERCKVKVAASKRANGATKHGAGLAVKGQKPQGTSAGERDENGNAKFNSGAGYQDCGGCAKCEENGGFVLRKGSWRATTAHEYVFQFSKSEDYFCDAEAAKERVSGNAHARTGGWPPSAGWDRTVGGGGHGKFRKVWDKGRSLAASAFPPRAVRDENRRRPGVTPKAVSGDSGADRVKNNSQWAEAMHGMVGNRNLRSVWRVNCASFKGAHFATYPPALIRPIIAAATSPWCCAQCGAPHAPVIERGKPNEAWRKISGADAKGGYHGKSSKEFELHGAENAGAVKARILAGMVEKKVTGHLATCRCGVSAGAARSVVFDPFGGSGTTGQVALELGRDAVLIELNPNYLPMIAERCRQPALL